MWLWLRCDAISRCNKTVPRNDDFTATSKRILREKRDCHTVAFSPALLLSSLSTVDAGEANENVRRDRIIHCPTKTGGASRLFGKRIRLVRATAILGGDRTKCFSPEDSISRFVFCFSNTFRRGVYCTIEKSRRLTIIILLLLYNARVIHFKKLSEYTINIFLERE